MIQPDMVEPDDLDDLHWEIIQELRDGRCTPSYLAENTGESRQLISQRLRDLVMAGFVEKVHTGLYELVEDPRDDSE
jgi:Bacterial regulatory protein, arsR family.